MVTSLDLLARQFMDTKVHIEEITGQIRDAAETDEQARLLQTMPGIGPITASAIVAHISDTSAFRTSRDLHLTQFGLNNPQISDFMQNYGDFSRFVLQDFE